MKKLQYPQYNSLFKKNTRTSKKDFLENCKYFFDGYDLHEIDSIDLELKNSLYTATLNCGGKQFHIKLDFLMVDSEIFFYIEYDKLKPKVYKSIQDFMKDLSEYQKGQSRIKEELMQRYEKKIKQMEEESKLISRISMKYPEYFL